MAEVIIQTRITPKKLLERIVPRSKLSKKIGENAFKNIILITGPAGYGKTTLALDFLNSKQINFAWLFAGADINNLYSFINYLVHSLRNLNPNFGENTLNIANSLKETQPEVENLPAAVNSIMGTFVNEFINTFKDEVYLVIDDLHNIDKAPWLISVFNYLIENFPANLHIIVTSRSVPAFNLARISSKRNLVHIEAEELNFSLEETEKLLKDVYSLNFKPEDVKILDEKVEGWITGLHLILQAYGNEFKKVASTNKLIDENIFGYFAEDIFRELDKETRDFLTVTSLLDSFTEEMCDRIFEIKSDEILSSIKKKNIFIESSLLGESFSYSYHNLFRQFLLSKLKETMPDEEIKKIAGKIYSFFREKGDNSSAIDFAVFAGEFEKAISLIKKSFDELFQKGNYDSLWKWMNLIPNELIDKDLELLFLKGKLLKYYRAEYESAYEVFEDVRKRTEAGEQLSVLSNAEIAELLIRSGKAAEAIEILEAQNKITEEPGLKIKIIISLAKAYYRLGSKNYSEIIRLLDEGSAICGEFELHELQKEIFRLYGKIYHHRGEFIKSLHYYENVAMLEHNIYRKYEVISDIVLLLSWSGQYIKAKGYLDKATEIYQMYPANAFKRNLMRISAMLKFETGDFEDAIRRFEELNRYDLNNNVKSFAFWYYLLICEAYMFLDQNAKAKEFLQLAEASKDSGDEYQAVEYELHSAILNKHEKAEPKIEKILISAHKYFDSLNLIYSKTQVEFHLADYFYKKSNPQTALKYLLDSLNTAAEKQYSSFLSQNFKQSRYLFDFAAANNIRRDYIEGILSSLLERPNIDWLSGECLKRLKQEQGNLYDITVLTFGGAELFVRGKRIPEDRWLRKKSKLLLIYLLINQNLKISKEKVLGIFFGELAADSAENIFHQAITNIRNVLKPEAVSGEDSAAGAKKIKKSKNEKETPAEKQKPGKSLEFSPSYLLYEDKILRMAPGYYFKVDAIELNKIHSLIKSPETDNVQKEKLANEALEIYKGEFLPGYYEPWIEEMRLTLENKFTDICEHIIRVLLNEKNHDEVIKFAEKLIETDKLHEEAYVNAIQAYSILGNHSMAKKKFSQMLKNYQDEFGEKPSDGALKRIESILLEN